MKFINFAVVRFSILLMLGILAAHFFPLDIFLLKPLVFLFGFLFILWFLARKQIIQNVLFGTLAYFCFFAIGYFSYQIHSPQFRVNHFSKIDFEGKQKTILFKIKEPLKADSYNYKYFADVKTVDGSPTTGKILITVPKEEMAPHFQPDEMIWMYGAISPIPKSLNPYQFDYSEYMETQGVHGQLRMTDRTFLKKVSGKKTIFGTAQRLRADIVEKLRNSKLKPDERAIVQALILGEKKDIGKNLYQEYAAAGAVHILAVSGLHVGILYLLIAFMLAPLKNWKWGIILHFILVVSLLWTFALLSGLSPSVTRAVTMFSCFAFANLINRRTNSINTLFLSLMPLLILNPQWLFQVGFQLSYLAVFFIVWLQPLLYKIGYSKYWLIRKVWAMVSVTLCAQIGVLPLTLYYFHQFPGLFLITNIVVLPFITILMIAGLAIVLLATFDILPDQIAEFYNLLIGALNGFIHWVAVQDQFLFSDIHFTTPMVVSAYFAVITIALFLKKRIYSRLMVSLLSISLFIMVLIHDDFKTAPNHFIVFHKNRNTLISYKTDRKMILFKNDTITNLINAHPIKSYRTAMDIRRYSEENLPRVFKYKEQNIMILDTLGLLPKQKEIHTVILSGNPRVNLERLIDSLKPKQIVADGNNYSSYTKRWKQTCQMRKLPFHHTWEEGAFEIR